MTSENGRSYVVLDVFTNEPLGGNPLAVVLNSEGLSGEQMQRIAAEFNLSETVFVSKAANDAHEAALRIFTPSQELPFAGHPTVGTAVLLAKRALGDVSEPTDKSFVLEEKVGPVRCGVVVRPGKSGHATFTMPKLSEEQAPPATRVLLAEALGIDVDDIGFDNHRPATFDAGLPYITVPVKSQDVVERLKPDSRVWTKVTGGGFHDSMFVYCRGGVDENAAFHGRMFFQAGGLREDPATGSAIASLSGAIASFEKLGDGEHTFLIEQGVEMGRPSQIMLELDIEDGAVFTARIGGNAVIVAEGVLHI